MKCEQSVRREREKRNQRRICENDERVWQMQRFVSEPKQCTVDSGRDDADCHETPDRRRCPIQLTEGEITVRFIIEPRDENSDDRVLDRRRSAAPNDERQEFVSAEKQSDR